MSHEITLDELPRKLSGYLNAVILPRRDYRRDDSLPIISVRRPAVTVEARHLEWFRRMCDYESTPFLPFVYPLTICFHYHLGVFAHLAFPWSLRRLLGLRNHVVQHRRIRAGEILDIAVSTQELRVRPRGVEFDILTVISSGREPVWESRHVYFLRCDIPDTPMPSARPELPPLSTVECETGWRAPRGGGWEFARLSGDLNPIHYFKPWAKAMGFRRPFCHTQRVVSECLKRLPDAVTESESEPLMLDVEFKGPVYYDSDLTLRSATVDGGTRFNLHCGGDPRPAIAGHVRTASQEVEETPVFARPVERRRRVPGWW